MKTVTINITGCDDETSFTATTDDIGLNVLRKIQRQSHHDGGGCKPVFNVYEGDAVVTAETIRASGPGSTWQDRHGAVWEWTGGGMAYHSQFGDLGEESLTEYVVQQSGPFTRSTAEPRGDHE